jgi:predicted RNase H-like nuclease (RuvC/YqgF family)
MDDNKDMVSAEKYQELKAIQSGLDRTITELQQKLSEQNNTFQSKFSEIKKEKTELENIIEKTNNNKEEDYLKRSELLDRKQRVLEISLDKGIAPQEALDLLGLNGMDDSDRLDLLGDMKSNMELDAADKFAKSHGTTPFFSLPKTSLSYDQILKMDDSDIAKLPSSVIEMAQEKVKPRRTLRDRIKGVK